MDEYSDRTIPASKTRHEEPIKLNSKTNQLRKQMGSKLDCFGCGETVMILYMLFTMTCTYSPSALLAKIFLFAPAEFATMSIAS